VNQELADHIILVAAPILAGLLAPFVATGQDVSAEKLKELRHHALTQALALRLDAMEVCTSPVS
jgi:hypothetical protein